MFIFCKLDLRLLHQNLLYGCTKQQLVSTNATKANKGDFHNVTFRKYSDEDVALWIYLSNTDLLAIRFYSGGVSMSRSANGGGSLNESGYIPRPLGRTN